MDLLVLFVLSVLIGAWRARARRVSLQPVAVRSEDRLYTRSRRIDWR